MHCQTQTRLLRACTRLLYFRPSNTLRDGFLPIPKSFGLSSLSARRPTGHTRSASGTALTGEGATSAPASGTHRGAGRSRAYPEEPRVGVGVIVFKTHPRVGEDPEILLVRRAKEPDKGRWCFPGGSLELGETLAACAAREVAEEAGLELLGSPEALRQDAGAWASSTAAHGAGDGVASAGKAAASARPPMPRLPLSTPTPFTAVDVLKRDAEGRVQFHYAVIEVAAVCADPQAVPSPGDDADGAQWVRVSRLRGLPDLTLRCDEVAEEAAARFAVPLP